LSGAGPLRRQIDEVRGEDTAAAVGRGRASATLAGFPIEQTDRSSAARAEALQARIDEVIGG